MAKQWYVGDSDPILLMIDNTKATYEGLLIAYESQAHQSEAYLARLVETYIVNAAPHVLTSVGDRQQATALNTAISMMKRKLTLDEQKEYWNWVRSVYNGVLVWRQS